MRTISAIGATTALALALAAPAMAQGGGTGGASPPAASAAIPTSNDLAIRATDLEPLEIAGGQYGFDVSQKTYELDIGTAYTLTIESPGVQECAWRAPEFFENIYIRKIEVGGVEVKARTFEEIEFGDEEPSEVELFFVPIRPGTFEWECRNLAQRDVVGEFVFK